MKPLTKLFTMAIFAAFIMLAGNDAGQQNREREDSYWPRIGSVPLQERGPAVSSPETTMTPNGDRYSPYPPYFRPDGGGGMNR
jgi:hypothetical protein